MNFFTLGKWFSTENEQNVAAKNYSSKVDDLKATLNLWKMRNLSLIGKVLILKFLALSRFVYSLSITFCSKDFVKKCSKRDKQIHLK